MTDEEKAAAAKADAEKKAADTAKASSDPNSLAAIEGLKKDLAELKASIKGTGKAENISGLSESTGHAILEKINLLEKAIAEKSKRALRWFPFG